MENPYLRWSCSTIIADQICSKYWRRILTAFQWIHRTTHHNHTRNWQGRRLLFGNTSRKTRATWRSVEECEVPAAVAAAPRGMRRRLIYDPPASPPPRLPPASERDRRPWAEIHRRSERDEGTFGASRGGLRNASVRVMRLGRAVTVTGDRSADRRLSERLWLRDLNQWKLSGLVVNRRFNSSGFFLTCFITTDYPTPTDRTQMGELADW